MRHFLSLVLLAAASSLQAVQTRMTFSGTIGSDSAVDSSYFGQAVTFSILTSGEATASGSFRNPDFYYYDETMTVDKDLFASMSGTYVTGSWQRPSNGNSAPFSSLMVDPSASQLYFYIANDYGVNLSLDFLGTPIHHIYINQYLVPAMPAISSSANYATVWQSLYGTYVVGAGDGSAFTLAMQGGSEVRLVMTSLTLESVGAVPEPSTYGLMLGGLALAGAVIRRRKVA